MPSRLKTGSRRKVWLYAAVGMAMGLSACVNPSEKIATGFVRYGLDEPQAQCVGDRLEKALSIGQLQQLGRAAKAVDRGNNTPGRLTVSDLIRASAEIKDPRVPLEVTKAAHGCGVLASGPLR